MTISSSVGRRFSSSGTLVEESIDVPNNQSGTENKVPSAPEAHNNNQPRLDERNVKSVSCFSAIFNAFKSCLGAIVSVFSYIFDKIDCFFTYILSKLLPKAKQDQATSASNNAEHLAGDTIELQILIEKSFFTTDEATPTFNSSSIVVDNPVEVNNPVEVHNPVVDNKSVINEESITDQEQPIANRESSQDGESSKEDQELEVTTDDTQSYQTPEDDSSQDSLSSISNLNSLNSFVFVGKQKNNREQDDNLEATSTPLDIPQEDTSETILGRFSKIISQAVGNLAKAQPHECFDNFFKQSASNNSSVDNLAAISSCSQEDFNTKFIERARYFLQKETNIELEPSKIIIFLKTKINFIHITERAATETESLEVQALIKKCRHMMHTALEHYTKQQIKAIADDNRYFTADDMLMYIPEETRSLLKKDKESEESANHQFIVDISRYYAKIKFFGNDGLLWDNSDLEAVELAKKMEVCNLELDRISQNTQEYIDKLSEKKEIETKLIQYNRLKIQKFLTTDPEIINILLLEQTQAAVAIPYGLQLQYCREKLNDVFGVSDNNQAIGTGDREYEIEFHKKQDNKITIRVILYGSMKFMVDSKLFNDLYSYRVTTEVEYDLQDSSNNRVIKGELKLFSKS